MKNIAMSFLIILATLTSAQAQSGKRKVYDCVLKSAANVEYFSGGFSNPFIVTKDVSSSALTI